MQYFFSPDGSGILLFLKKTKDTANSWKQLLKNKKNTSKKRCLLL